MTSKLVEALQLKLQPVSLLWQDEKPEKALEFKEGKWGCLMFHLVAAAKGKTAVVSRTSYGCYGGGVGMGLGNCYEQYPGGTEGFYRFLSEGNRGVAGAEHIAEALEKAGNKTMAHEFLYGERYLKNADAARRFVDTMAPREIPAAYVVMRPMEEGDPDNPQVKSITFFVNADQLAALTVLSHYDTPDRERVIAPFAAGCQATALALYKEHGKEFPRAIIGLMDLAARKNTRHLLPPDMLSFSLIPAMFKELESHVAGSFLETENWRNLIGSAD
ncbi:MAG TPA: DUF169 domain-containing protein [Candidatus Hydrogenedentes bacterium]|jgi:uncharacterized protein (DUF169 family)|nr:MAG: hypothetical protein BWY07_00079 [Candidatus Hydrogenedentes bacterium ADurb.Bin170]HOD94142.1 DUF169 domain-containing protein [Candidatus Hydrogenedentota bacterium]HOM47607.1 DUF169 domain-containing protein [Candidatus Hydrogenedentota bacterium]HOR49550.1 DUF169 domain-containing protein [Candidatus Hydrogenedentota bacterium]HPK23522.1 DUF169 domain-containing protein [Candidatus Hydrogenedentota bacterium]